MLYTQVNVPVEVALTAEKTHSDIFNELEVDVLFTGPGGIPWKVPAYWAGDNVFRARFAPPKVGRYTFTSSCTDASDGGLHGRQGEVVAKTYDGSNALFQRGRLRVAAAQRTLEHADGTPFFWLADTWWMGLCKRLGWPADFRLLTADRVAKGFSVIQIIAGLYPDMPAFDERGANEAGYPWEKDYARINPAYFDQADVRLEWLVRSGLMPCVVGCWGYFLPWMGVEKLKKHWRNLVARYSAYPVVWCLAGEGTMPYYLSTTREEDAKLQKQGWTEIARYVRAIDPLRNLVTVHPTDNARNQVEDPAVVDFDMLQTGHGDRQSLPATVEAVTRAFLRKPAMPVINGEVCYEGIGEACRQEVQRLMFWTCVLSGAAGHTYGANGIWQLNARAKPYGPSPHGMSWGNTPWEDAYQLPGSGQLGLAKKLLERYQWWKFEPHPEWIEPRWTNQNYTACYAAGIPRKLRIIYIPLGGWAPPVVKALETGVRYRTSLFNPASGELTHCSDIKGDTSGSCPISVGNKASPSPPIYQDWVAVLHAMES